MIDSIGDQSKPAVNSAGTQFLWQDPSLTTESSSRREIPPGFFSFLRDAGLSHFKTNYLNIDSLWAYRCERVELCQSPLLPSSSAVARGFDTLQKAIKCKKVVLIERALWEKANIYVISRKSVLTWIKENFGDTEFVRHLGLDFVRNLKLDSVRHWAGYCPT